MTESNVRFRHIKVTGGPIYRCQKWSNGLAIFGPLILHLFLQKKWSRCDLHFGKVVNFVPSLFRGFAPPGSCPPWLFLCSGPQNFARMEDSAGFYRFSQESARFCTFPVDFAGCVCLLRPPPSSNHQRVSYFCDALSFLGFLPPLCGFAVRAFLFLMIRRRGAATAQGRPGDHKCYDDLPPYRSPCPVQGTKTKTWRRKPHGRAGISTVHQGSLLWKTKNGEKH